AEVFHGVGIDRLVGAAVGPAIRLVVAGQVDSAGGNSAGHRGFPDGAPGGTTVVVELARQTDVDGENLASSDCHTPSLLVPGGNGSRKRKIACQEPEATCPSRPSASCR